MKKWLLGLIFLLIPSLALAASSYYVDNSVGASGNGSSGSPWKNLSNINWTTIGSASKPCTIYISGGATSQTYSEQLAPGASGSGTGSEVIIKRPTEAEWASHGGIVYVRTTTATVPLLISSPQTYIIIDGIDFNSTAEAGMAINGADYITIRNCVSKDNAGFGLAAWNNADHCLIQNNQFGPNDPSSGDDPMQIGAIDDWIIEKNIIWPGRPTGAGHYDGIQSNVGTSVTIRYNIFREGNNAAIYTEALSGNITNWLIYGNIFEYTAGSGYSNAIWTSSSGGYYQTLYIYNNTFVNWGALESDGAALYASGYSDASDVVIFKNNILYNSRLVKSTGFVGTLTMDYNIYYGPAQTGIVVWSNDVEYTAGTFGTFKTVSGQEAHGQATNPLLTSVTSTPSTDHDLRPTATSPGNNVGVVLGLPYDYGLTSADVKASWPLSVVIAARGAAYDIGPYEYQESGGTARPPIHWYIY